MNAEPDSRRLNALVEAFGPRVFAYVRRHVEHDAIEDIVAETFLTAWRRLAQVPEEPLPWLLVVARNVVANHRRRQARRERVQTELAAIDRVLPAVPAVDDVVVDRLRMLAALTELTTLEREAILLTGWDGLSDAQAARVCGCSPRTFRVRLHPPDVDSSEHWPRTPANSMTARRPSRPSSSRSMPYLRRHHDTGCRASRSGRRLPPIRQRA